MPVRPFDEWKTQLFANAARCHCSEAASSLGDYVLVLFWSDGCEPTVEGILHHSSQRRKPPEGVPPPASTRRFLEST